MRSVEGGWRIDDEAKSQWRRSRENLKSDTRRSSSWQSGLRQYLCLCTSICVSICTSVLANLAHVLTPRILARTSRHAGELRLDVVLV